MRIRRLIDGIEVVTPAKVNLFFEVLARRADGYHEIESLMAPVEVFDTVFLRDASQSLADDGREPVVAECAWVAGLQRTKSAVSEPAGQAIAFEPLPIGKENLAVRAVELLRNRSGTNRHAVVRLTKRIPAAAGLGGGSSDAAAALVAANIAWDLNWSRAKLSELAAELGSDVPFFLHSGPAVARGRGEQIDPVGRFGRLHLVVVRPPEGLSTAEVYRACRPSSSPRRIEPLLAALRRGDVRQLGQLLHNVLQAAARGLSPWIDRLEHEFAELDCLASQMSGSGTSYFGICRSARHASRVAGYLRSRRLGYVFTATGG